MAQVTKHLPRKHEAPNSNSGTGKKSKQKKKKLQNTTQLKVFGLVGKLIQLLVKLSP
jgi:hypothetical protein